MANQMWYAELEDRVFTVLRTKLNNAISTRYPHLVGKVTYTSDYEVNTSPHFPTVWFRQIDSDEIMEDIYGHSVNGIYMRCQCEVYAQDERTAKRLSYECMSAMKSMGFSAYFLPKRSASRTGVARFVARYRRNVGVNDALANGRTNDN